MSGAGPLQNIGHNCGIHEGRRPAEAVPGPEPIQRVPIFPKRNDSIARRESDLIDAHASRRRTTEAD